MPHYGKLNVKSLPSEVYKIWLTRDDELPELPSHKWSWEFETDPDLPEYIDLAHKLVLSGRLTELEDQAIALMLQDATLQDIGEALGDKSKARVQQIIEKSLRRLRRRQEDLTGWPAENLTRSVGYWRWFRRRTTEKYKDYKDEI